MEEVLVILVTSIVMLIAGIGFGNSYSNGAVARDCVQLGAFYVNDKVFECKLKGK